MPKLSMAVDHEGGVSACPSAAAPLAECGDDALAAWQGIERDDLNTSLAQGLVPSDHCRACATWVHAAYAPYAPFARTYARSQTPVTPTEPSWVALHLPSSASPEALAGALAKARRLTLFIRGAVGPALADWMPQIAMAEGLKEVQLVVEQVEDHEAIATLLADTEVTEVTVTLQRPDPQRIESAKALACKLEATIWARFVVTPEDWFWFEDVARLASDHSVPLDFQLVDDSGRIPLEGLAVEDLGIVKDVVTSAWMRFRGDACPASVSTGSFHQLGEQIRGILTEVAQASLDPRYEEPEHSLGLPGLDHPWCTDAEREPWWTEQIFGQSHVQTVVDWFERLVEADDGAGIAEAPSLRTLCKKLAWEKRQPATLRALKTIYGDVESLARREQEDRQFEEAFDLSAYGGPWNGLLGLPREPRSTPIDPADPTAPPQATEPARVTVLIPSYKHEAFIELAIRSVLAQTESRLKLIVADDCSPDRTVEIARAISDPRLEVTVNTQNLGLGNSVLAALEQIDTPFVALLNSDDLFHPERLARCLAVLDENPEVQVVTTGLQLIDPNGGSLTADNVSFALDGIDTYNWVHWYDGVRKHADIERHDVFTQLLECNFLATSSNLVTRTRWLRDQERSLQDLKYCLDWQIFLEAAAQGALHHLAENLVGYRLHDTNTVWFQEGNRWEFFLEVNRVLAEALRSCSRRTDLPEADRIEALTESVVHHLSKCREADGLALVLNTLTDSAHLNQLAHDRPELQSHVKDLHLWAARTLKARDEAGRLDREASHHQKESRRALLATLRRERASNEKETMRLRCDELAQTLREVRGETTDLRNRLTDIREQSRETRQGLEGRLADLRTRTETERKGYESRLQELRGKLAAANQDLRDLREKLTVLRADLSTERDALATTQAELEALRIQLTEMVQERSVLSEELTILKAQSNELRRAKDELTRRNEDLVRFRNRLLTESSRLQGEVRELRASREYRIGRFLWQTLPIGYMSRTAKKWLNKLLDAKNRIGLWAETRLRKTTAEGTAVVASCWHWPIYSHTFVYQEMIGLTHMGMDVKMLHWAANDMDQLQPAFSYLKDNRVQIKSNMKQHQKDREHFEKTRPGRLDALLQKVSTATGKSVEDLRDDPMILRACTFSRMVELADARYLHSYFFYDQSFMVLVASWLLELPRGVSCYADHMLDDYPFKVVALQLQLADVVVATSARIKEELVGIGGEEIADKVIVKPNGVNGERFPAIDRGPRRPDDPFEVISISRLEPKKGLEYLVEAVAELKKRGRKVICHIIGAVDTSLQASIDYGTALEEQIAELGLESEILLHGMMMHERIQPLMQRCRAFVAPYVELESGDKDGIPTAMLEALASGLPIVTTDSGSILEVVQHDQQAMVAPQRDSAAYAEALDRLICEPDTEQRLSREARRRFDREFDIKVTERRLHERIATILKDTTKSPA